MNTPITMIAPRSSRRRDGSRATRSKRNVVPGRRVFRFTPRGGCKEAAIASVVNILRFPNFLGKSTCADPAQSGERGPQRAGFARSLRDRIAIDARRCRNACSRDATRSPHRRPFVEFAQMRAENACDLEDTRLFENAEVG